MTHQPHTPQALATMLRAGMPGYACERTATDLLLTDGHWLGHPEWVARCVRITPDTHEPSARIDWAETRRALEHAPHLRPDVDTADAAQAARWRAAEHVLMLAASLAAGYPVDMGQAMAGQEPAVAAAAARAVIAAAGAGFAAHVIEVDTSDTHPNDA